MVAPPENDFHRLLFGVRRSVRYHARRERFYDSFHQVVVFMALVFGSTTLAAFGAALGAGWPLWLKLLPAALTTLFSALDLVVGSVRKARRHADLVRQFTELERQLEAGREAPSAALLAEVTDRRLQIEATEPPVLRVLDTLCHNELLRAMGYPRERQVRVGPLQRVCAPLFDVAEHRLSAAGPWDTSG